MKRLIRMSLIATTGMTLASYLIAITVRKKMLPPVLLNQLTHPEEKTKKAHNIKGYLLHWLVGLSFSAMYKALWKKKLMPPDARSGLALGFANGIAGIAGWHLMLKLHPRPPVVKRKPFYIHLLATHIIFGYLNHLAFRKSKSQDQKMEC
jgi:hypothetical protein